MASLAALAAVLAGGCSRVAVRSAAPETLLVTGGEQLQAISAQSLALLAQMRLGGPVTATATRGTELLLAIGGAHPALLRIEGPQGRMQAKLPLGLRPSALLVDGDAGRILIAGTRSDGSGWLSARDARTGKVVGGWSLPGRASAMALTADGQLAITVVQPAELLLAHAPYRHWRKVVFDTPPRQVVSLPYGHKAFVLESTTAAVVDTSLPGLLTYLPLGQDPQQMVIKPDGGELYISNAGGTVSVINTSTNEVSGTMPAGLGAGAMAVTPSGSTLYVANAAAGTITAVSLADRTVQAVIHVGQQPSALALDASGALLFASDTGSNDVAVMRAQDPTNPNTLLTLLPSPPQPGFLTVIAH